MGEEILIALVVWLTIGVVIGGWISVDTFRRKVKGAKWVAAGVLLSVIGLALYLMVKKKSTQQTELHPPPEYSFKEPAAPEANQAPMAESIVEPEPVAPQPMPEPEPVQTTPEPVSPVPPPVAAPETVHHDPSTWAPVVREKIAGIPRCPKCGSAISAYDDFCSECGAKLK